MESVTEKSEHRAAILFAAVLWGSLWGIWEATAGFLLHLLRIPGAAGLIMFPAGFFMMSRAFAQSGTPAAVFLTGCTAAAIKLVDLFLPGIDLFSVVNPAQAILLESLAVAGIFSIHKGSEHVPFRALAAASISWRLAYVFLGLLTAQFFPVRNLFQAGSIPLLRFLLIDGAANGLLIFLMVRLQKLPAKRQGLFFPPISAAASVLVFAAALLIELFN